MLDNPDASLDKPERGDHVAHKNVQHEKGHEDDIHHKKEGGRWIAASLRRSVWRRAVLCALHYVHPPWSGNGTVQWTDIVTVNDGVGRSEWKGVTNEVRVDRG